MALPSCDAVDDVELELRLYGESVRAANGRVDPDFARVKRELAGKGVTLQLLRAEYVSEIGADGGAYSNSRI
ncbi:MAG: hypothetical protein H7287_10340 [Thermoleophilia bacterium]|nr:hypothetical protein [Thermoleophilia bacterium]